MVRKSSLLALIALFTAVGAQAALKISLVTVTPGPVIFDSFGHSAVLVENPDISSDAVLYEYGNVNANKLFNNPNPIGAFNDLFDSRVKTMASRSNTPMFAPANSPRFPLVLRYRYLLRSDANRAVTIDELDLTQEQATKLVELMDKDIAAGEYNYDNYKNNCATRIRDRLFDDAVLGSSARQLLDLKAEADTSLQSLVFESFDEAKEASTRKEKVVQLMPDYMARSSKGKQALMLLRMVDIPGEYKSSGQFYDSLQKADNTLADYKDDPEMGPLQKAFHKYFFSPELTEKPITDSQTMFLPKRLRAVLLKTANPSTGRGVIDVSKEFRRSSDDEHVPVKPLPTAPRPATTTSGMSHN